MPVQIEVFRYQDESVDEQATPNVMHVTAAYVALDTVTGKATPGQCAMAFPLSLSRANRAAAIKTAVREHVAAQLGRPELQPADNTGVFIPISQ